MWRRACLGDAVALRTLLLVWAGLLLVVASVGLRTHAWVVVASVAVVVVVVPALAFWRRRRVWDRWVRGQTAEGVAALEALLDRRRRRH